MTSTKWKWLLASVLVVILICAYVYKNLPSSPRSNIELARQEILNAQKMKSNEYAKLTLEKATMLYDSAMTLWKLENNRFILWRDFEPTNKMAERASETALLSQGQASELRAFLKLEILEQIDHVNADLKQLKTLFQKFPLSESERNDLSKAKILFHEGQKAFDKGDYIIAQRKVNKAKKPIAQVSNTLRKKIETYFESYPRWSKQAREIIEWSKSQKTYSLVIDKYARKCMVYKSGVLKGTFDVELGPNWVGDKKFRGDKATPEGLYQITSKKADPHTKYHKALLLNYPNEEDKKRFDTNKKSGLIAANKTIGNLIEIHGHGGKGTDWTDGCVALSNKDMDFLFSYCENNTRIAIIGSSVDFQDLTSAL